MPRKPFQIQAFHGGINSKSDKRDISDTQVAEAIDISIDDIGMVTNAGAFVDASIGGTVPIATASGYGLFRFSSDYDDDYNGSATPVRTDYLLSWRNADKQLYWSPGGGNWASPTHLDTSSDWQEAKHLKQYSIMLMELLECLTQDSILLTILFGLEL